MPANPRRIGVLRTASIGDTLLLSGVVTDLGRAFPNAEIVLITGEGNAEMGLLVARGRARHLQVRVARPAQAALALRREKFDVLIDSGPWPRFDAILTALGGARFTVGFRSGNQARHFAYDRVVAHRREVHEVENFRALIRAIGVEGSTRPFLSVGKAARPSGVPSEPYLVFHPWSGGYRAHLREWPNERWSELAKGLADVAANILISGGPHDVKKSEDLARLIERAGVRCASIAGMSIEPMIAVLQHTALVVGVNTSITHLASLLEQPTVMLEGPTSPQRWGLLGPRSLSVCSEFPGCGFVYHGFEYKGQREDCMMGISVAAVLKGVRSVLALPA